MTIFSSFSFPGILFSRERVATVAWHRGLRNNPDGTTVHCSMDRKETSNVHDNHENIVIFFIEEITNLDSNCKNCTVHNHVPLHPDSLIVNSSLSLRVCMCSASSFPSSCPFTTSFWLLLWLTHKEHVAATPVLPS